MVTQVQLLALTMGSSERLEDVEKICIKCGRKNSDHPATGRFNTIVLYGPECAWNPDDEFRDFVMNSLKSSGYNLHDFGYD